jgi:hypothetical protein
MRQSRSIFSHTAGDIGGRSDEAHLPTTGCKLSEPQPDAWARRHKMERLLVNALGQDMEWGIR